MWKISVLFLSAAFCAECFSDNWSIIEDPRIFVEPVGDAPSESRIIGGTEVVPNSIPYQAALVIWLARGQSFCGGSLISPNYVLTAAHCMDSAVKAQVILGAHNIRQGEPSQFRVTSQDIKVHPGWNNQNFQNDVALIKLPTPVSLSKYINTIRLARSGTFAASTALLTGWGKTSDISSVSNVLHQVFLQVLDNSACGMYYPDFIVPGHICTSGADIKGGCNGDSGGPLVVNGEQIGIVSFGSNRCTRGYPTVFTRVTAYIDWIAANSDVIIY